MRRFKENVLFQKFRRQHVSERIETTTTTTSGRGGGGGGATTTTTGIGAVAPVEYQRRHSMNRDEYTEEQYFTTGSAGPGSGRMEIKPLHYTQSLQDTFPALPAAAATSGFDDGSGGGGSQFFSKEFPPLQREPKMYRPPPPPVTGMAHSPMISGTIGSAPAATTTIPPPTMREEQRHETSEEERGENFLRRQQHKLYQLREQTLRKFVGGRAGTAELLDEQQQRRQAERMMHTSLPPMGRQRQIHLQQQQQHIVQQSLQQQQPFELVLDRYPPQLVQSGILHPQQQQQQQHLPSSEDISAAAAAAIFPFSNGGYYEGGGGGAGGACPFPVHGPFHVNEATTRSGGGIGAATANARQSTANYDELIQSYMQQQQQQPQPNEATNSIISTAQQQHFPVPQTTFGTQPQHPMMTTTMMTSSMMEKSSSDDWWQSAYEYLPGMKRSSSPQRQQQQQQFPQEETKQQQQQQRQTASPKKPATMLITAEDSEQNIQHTFHLYKMSSPDANKAHADGGGTVRFSATSSARAHFVAPPALAKQAATNAEIRNNLTTGFMASSMSKSVDSGSATTAPTVIDRRHCVAAPREIVDLPERVHYHGQPIRVEIAGPVHFLHATNLNVMSTSAPGPGVGGTTTSMALNGQQQQQREQQQMMMSESMHADIGIPLTPEGPRKKLFQTREGADGTKAHFDDEQWKWQKRYGATADEQQQQRKKVISPPLERYIESMCDLGPIMTEIGETLRLQGQMISPSGNVRRWDVVTDSSTERHHQQQQRQQQSRQAATAAAEPSTGASRMYSPPLLGGTARGVDTTVRKTTERRRMERTQLRMPIVVMDDGTGGIGIGTKFTATAPTAASSSLTPYLVESTSHCHLARVTEITQEWRIQPLAVVQRQQKHGNAIVTELMPSSPQTESASVAHCSCVLTPRYGREFASAHLWTLAPTIGGGGGRGEGRRWSQSTPKEEQQWQQSSEQQQQSPKHLMEIASRNYYYSTLQAPTNKRQRSAANHANSDNLPLEFEQIHKTRSYDPEELPRVLGNHHRYESLQQTLDDLQRNVDDDARRRRQSQHAKVERIERAILAISERIDQQSPSPKEKQLPPAPPKPIVAVPPPQSEAEAAAPPVSKAHAEAREELLRVRLAQMILNLDPDSEPNRVTTTMDGNKVAEERQLKVHAAHSSTSDVSLDNFYGEALRAPIGLLHEKLALLERRLLEEQRDDINGQLRLISATSPPLRTDQQRRRQQALSQRHDDIARMTPLIGMLRHKLASLDEQCQRERQNMAISSCSGRLTPYEERKTVHELLVRINAEIETIHELCRQQDTTKDRLDTVLMVLKKVANSIDRIMETLDTIRRTTAFFTAAGAGLPSGSKQKGRAQQMDKAGMLGSNTTTLAMMKNGTKTTAMTAAPDGSSTKKVPPQVPPKRKSLTASTISMDERVVGPLRSIVEEHDDDPMRLESITQQRVNAVEVSAHLSRPVQSASRVNALIPLLRTKSTFARLTSHLRPPTIYSTTTPKSFLFGMNATKAGSGNSHTSSLTSCLPRNNNNKKSTFPTKLHSQTPPPPPRIVRQQQQQQHEQPKPSLLLTASHSGSYVSAENNSENGNYCWIGDAAGPMPMRLGPCPISYLERDRQQQQQRERERQQQQQAMAAAAQQQQQQQQQLQQRRTTSQQQQRHQQHHLQLQQQHYLYSSLDEDDEETISVSMASSSMMDNSSLLSVPILFRRQKSSVCSAPVQATITDEGEREVTCTETFVLRRRRKHAVLNAIIYPEQHARVRAAFWGNNFEVDVERMTECGRDSVVMVSEEFYDKKVLIRSGSSVRKSTIMEEMDRESSEENTSAAYVNAHTRMAVSINAKSDNDSVHVFLEEIPWGQIGVDVKAATAPSSSFVSPAVNSATLSPSTLVERPPTGMASSMESSFTRDGGGFAASGRESVLKQISVSEGMSLRSASRRSSQKSLVTLQSERNGGAGGGTSNASFRLSGGQEDDEQEDIPAYVIKSGATASITCELNSDCVGEGTRIEWFRGQNEQILAMGGKFERHRSEDFVEVLVIFDVCADDGQLYSVKINGELYPVAYLIIEEEQEEEEEDGREGSVGGAPTEHTNAMQQQQRQEPQFLTAPQTQFVMQGETAIISVAMNKANLNVVWHLDGKILDSEMSGGGGGAKKRLWLETTTTGWYRVIITEVQFADQGFYYAQIGDKFTSVQLIVEDRIDEREVQVSSAETDDEELGDYLVPAGSTATIACELENVSFGYRLHWQRNHRDLDAHIASGDGKFEHVVNGTKHYLIIHCAQPADSGVYSVRIGDAKFKVAQITISSEQPHLTGSGGGGSFSRVKRISSQSLNRMMDDNNNNKQREPEEEEDVHQQNKMKNRSGDGKMRKGSK